MESVECQPIVRQIGNADFFAVAVERLAEGKTVKLRPKGDSMYPTIRADRDLIFIDPCSGSSVRVGNVVLARLGDDSYVIHRIVKADGDRLTLMGDGNIYGTELCSRNGIRGVVNRIERNGVVQPLPSPFAARVRRLKIRFKIFVKSLLNR